VLADTEHVIERLPNGRFNQDDCRLRYLRWLRDPERRSARSEAAAKHAEAKTQLLHIRIEEKQRKLVRRDDVNELIDQVASITLTHLSGMAARCSPDMVVRRNIDAVVMQIRREISEACSKAADERNEPRWMSRTDVCRIAANGDCSGGLQFHSRSGRRDQRIRPVTQQRLDHKHDRPDDGQFRACANKEKSLPNCPEVGCPRD
jgi:hypothetical protein